MFQKSAILTAIAAALGATNRKGERVVKVVSDTVLQLDRLKCSRNRRNSGSNRYEEEEGGGIKDLPQRKGKE